MHAVEAQVGEAGLQLAQVVGRRAVQLAHAAQPRRGGLAEQALDLGLLGVVELGALGAEELDPVVLVGVVRGRHDRGQVEPVAAHQQRGARAWAARRRAARGRRPAATPAASAASSISPDSRVSLTISTWGASAGEIAAAARPSAVASSALRNSPGDAANAVGAKQLAGGSAPVDDAPLHASG